MRPGLAGKEDGDRGKAALVLAANQLACRLYQEELEASADTLAYLEGRGTSTSIEHTGGEEFRVAGDLTSSLPYARPRPPVVGGSGR